MKKRYSLFSIIGFIAGILLVFYDNNQLEATSMSEKDIKWETATFAGGCFWCVESDFEKVEGVGSVISGYTGGTEKNPTYEEVSSGSTGHLEAIEVRFDPNKISYGQLLDVFWRHIDPTDSEGQFVDQGPQYRSAIFYHTEEQRVIAEESKAALEKSGQFQKPIVTEIRKATEFYPAEGYHQDYYKNNTMRYEFYRYNSGRDQFLKKVWAKDKMQNSSVSGSGKYTRPPDQSIRKMLNPMQYEVTQENGTEPPFKNEFWNNKKEGIYIDIVSGEPLFSSTDKFDSGTGWPSFTRPIAPENVVEKEDRRFFMNRTEVRSKYGNSHLGHLFNDGPGKNGLRYCINSASLRFIPKEELEAKGYGKYLELFQSK